MSKYHINNPEELRNVLFHDFQLIKQMRTLEANKIKLLSNLFSINRNCWRVVGITPDALEIFKNHEFQKKSRISINRSHIIQRFSFYKSLLENNNEIKNAETFWKLYYDNDMTVLASASENMSNNETILKNAYPVPEDERNLFQTSGYSWKHKEEEIKFLKELYNYHLLQQKKIFKILINY